MAIRPEKYIRLDHVFVKHIPDELKEGIIYVSIDFATALHKCCCGCGNEVVTPLSPTDWRLTFDGKTVSLYPSIGCWNFECKSHYWIERSRVKWSYQMSQREINAGRKQDRLNKRRYFKNQTVDPTIPNIAEKKSGSD